MFTPVVHRHVMLQKEGNGYELLRKSQVLTSSLSDSDTPRNPRGLDPWVLQLGLSGTQSLPQIETQSLEGSLQPNVESPV